MVLNHATQSNEFQLKMKFTRSPGLNYAIREIQGANDYNLCC